MEGFFSCSKKPAIWPTNAEGTRHCKKQHEIELLFSTQLLPKSFSSTELINKSYEPAAVMSEQELPYKRCE